MIITVRAITEDIEVLNAARRTVWKDDVTKEPSEKFMYDIYMSEHSPIRDKWYVIEIEGIPYWLSTHFVRHSVGYTPYVSTQREDRIDYTGTRDDRKQGELVNMRITLNAQAFINVSKKRLCKMAHPKAQEVWQSVVDKLSEIDSALAHHCVPNCVYRNGLCSEPNYCKCKFNRTPKFDRMLETYISRIRENVSRKSKGEESEE